MAELPKYQQTGRVFADVPEFSFANVKESFRRSQSMINSLDRISQFAGKFAETQAEQQAAQYAIDNPITIEELRVAQESGVDPNDLITKVGGGTVWQETLRKVQGEQLRAQLEVHGQQALSDIQTQVQLGQLTDINEIKQKFQSAITGFEKPLARVSLESALRFQQSMASTAKAFFNEATKKLETDYINDQQVLSMQNLDKSFKAAKSMIGVLNDPQMLEESKRLLGYRVYEQAREGGTAFAQKQLETFNKEFDAMKLNHFTEVATNPKFATTITQAVQKMNAGDFGEASMLWQGLDKDEQAKVRKNVVAAWGDMYTVTKQEQEMLKIANKERDDADVVRLYSPQTPDTEKRKLAIDLYKRDVITESTLDNVLNPKKEESDVDNITESRAESDIIGGYIKSEKELRKLYPTLPNKSVARLIPKIASGNAQKATRLIRVFAGASESPLAILDENTSSKIKKMNDEMEQIKRDSFAKGEPIDDVAAAQIAIKNYSVSKEYTDAKSSQKSSYRTLSTAFPDFNPDTMNPDDYAKKKKLDAARLQQIKRNYNTYKSAKKITNLSAGEFGE